MDSFEDQEFREAVEATGRKRLIIGGLQTEVCLTFAVVEALKAGYEVQFVTDATGSRTPAEHRTAIERMAHAGAVPNTSVGWSASSSATGLRRSAPRARKSPTGTSREIPKVTDKVGIAEAELARASGPRRGASSMKEVRPRNNRVGIIGAGRLGQAMARTALRAGREVVIANSRGPESLASVVSALGEGASAGTVDEARAARIVVIAVPWDKSARRPSTDATGMVRS